MLLKEKIKPFMKVVHDILENLTVSQVSHANQVARKNGESFDTVDKVGLVEDLVDIYQSQVR